MNPGSSGFANAPSSKLLIIVVAACSILATVLNVRHNLFLDRLSLIKLEVWRAVSSHFFFLSTGEMFSGLLLLYSFRMFERQMGEKKFAIFVFITMAISTLLELAVLVLTEIPEFTLCGPYALIFALFVQYFYDTPPFFNDTSLGIPLSDKLFTYFLGLQLMFSRGYPSLAHAAIGIVAGLLYRFEGLGLQKFKCPPIVSHLCQTYIRPVLITSPSTHEIVNMAEDRRRQGVGQVPIGAAGLRNRRRLAEPQAAYAQPQPQPGQQQPIQPHLFSNAQLQQQQNRPEFRFQNSHVQREHLQDALSALGIGDPLPNVQPSQANITELVNMGFDRQIAVDALSRTNDQLQLAIHALLEG